MRWRRVLAKTVLRIFRGEVFTHYRRIKEIEKDREAIEEFQRSRLNSLLRHCYQHVPFYRELLEEEKVVTSGLNGGQLEVHLENFSNLPLLTKDMVREHDQELKAAAGAGGHVYQNASGGSTGKPLVFLQDRAYQDWNWANKLYFNEMVGKSLGEPEIKLWGSQRDIMQGTLGLKDRAINFFLNRTFLNSFKMSASDMRRYLGVWNEVEPVSVWAYVGSIYELAKFKKKEGIHVVPPRVIITTAGVLDEKMRQLIEDAFGCPVLNQYGSREEGAVACECEQQDGLHFFEHSHYVEVVDDHCQPAVGAHGDIVITNLNNYAMPLLRYSLEDTGVMEDAPCRCGRKFKKLSRVTGRKLNHFITPDGEIVHGMYFTHMFYFKDWVHKFRVVQEEVRLVRVMIETNREPVKHDLREFKEKIQKVMGEDCRVEFRFHDRLDPAPSGKFVFTESKVK